MDAYFGRGRNLVFVGGSPRSGTTLVQNILDSHPDIAGGPEFDRIPDIVDLRNALHQSIENKRIDIFLSKEQVDQQIGIFIEQLLSGYARKRNRRMLSEKTPRNVLHFRSLIKILPEARFIFCVRDPRAVVASMLQVGKRGKTKDTTPVFTRKISRAIKQIKQSNSAGFGALRSSDRVMLICYEQLVRFPEAETKRLCEFLDLPWSAEMLVPGERKHDGEATVDDVWYDQATYYSNPEPARIDQWRSQLTPLQQGLVTAAFKDDRGLAEAGFDLAVDDCGMVARLALLALYDGRKWISWRANQIQRVTRKGLSVISRLRAGRFRDATPALMQVAGDHRSDHERTSATIREVASSFDAFADTYDWTMRAIKYRAPELLYSAVTERLKDVRDAKILDAGCGTGLCGVQLRPFALRLDGIDLSSSMIAKARERGIYDWLDVIDLTTYLNLDNQSYDVIVSGGVLQYFSNLDTVFHAVAKSLRPAGIFGFTLDRHDGDEDIVTSPRSGHMYLHSRSYVIRMASAAGFSILSMNDIVDRNDMIRYQPVPGLLALMEKN